jgi:Uma2 family endonuclease
VITNLVNRHRMGNDLGMQAVSRAERVSVEDYLESEKSSEVRHEYVGGILYAMAGASDEHIAICVNLVSALRNHLKGTPCRVQISEGKVRLRAANEEIFYYPELMVICDPRDQDRYFKRYPKVLIEVLSESTETIDRREKFLSYRQIETLEEYVLVAQDKMEVTVFARAKGWQPEISTQPEQSLRLPSLKFSQLLSQVYDGLNV